MIFSRVFELISIVFQEISRTMTTISTTLCSITIVGEIRLSIR